MEVVENLAKWNNNYQNGCLENFAKTGKIIWNKYAYVKNTTSPVSTGIDPARSKLLFISSAGGYLPNQDKPFDASNVLGDYSVRKIPITAEFNEIDFAHEHYDTEAVRFDAQVLLPFKHLQKLADEKIIGELCETTVHFMGYQPDLHRVVTEMIPEILEIAKQQKATAALLVPS
jgi:hypothetical protein